MRSLRPTFLQNILRRTFGREFSFSGKQIFTLRETFLCSLCELMPARMRSRASSEWERTIRWTYPWPASRTKHFERDEKNRFRRIKDSEGHIVNYDYDSAGRLIQVSGSQGNTEVYRYDEKSQIVAVVDGQGHVQMKITYSPDGWITGQALPDGRTFQCEYRRGKDGSLAEIRFTDPRGYVTLFDYVGQQYLQSLPSKSPNPNQADAQPFVE